MSENVQLIPLKEPEVSVWGLTLHSREHICEPQQESKSHPILKATPIEQVVGKTIWFVDSSSYYTEGTRVTGFAGICLTGNRQEGDSFQYRWAKGGIQFAEVAVVLEVLHRMKDKQMELIIGTDSEYVYKGIAIYLPWWNSIGSTGTDGSDIKHKALWQQMEKLAKQYKKIRMVKIKAHKGSGPLQQGNELADTLAKEAALTGTLWEPTPVAVTTRAQAKHK
ncbi:ribonuclease H, partial [Chelydra serpentina]